MNRISVGMVEYDKTAVVCLDVVNLRAVDGGSVTVVQVVRWGQGDSLGEELFL